MYRKVILAAVLMSVSACAGTGQTGGAGKEESVSDLLSAAADRSIAATNAAAVTGNRVPLTQRVGPDALPDAGNGPSSAGTDATGRYLVPPPETLQPVSAKWNGEVEGLVAHLASRAGYRVLVSGPRPAVTMSVAVVANEEPLRSVMARVSAMTRGYAVISMDEKAKTVNFRYVR